METAPEFRIFGPLDVAKGDRHLDIGHARQRCILAVLLVEPNRTISTEELVDRIWGERPPKSARNVLYGYIGRLRGAIAEIGCDAGRLERRSGGYILNVDPERVDLHLFRRLVRDAWAVADDEAIAVTMFRRALNLSRDPAFTDVAACTWLDNVRTRIDRDRHEALLKCLDLELRLGRHAQLLGEIEALSANHPLDETAIRYKMIILHQCGRRAEALDCYQRFRKVLADELGTDPGAALRELHEQILHDAPCSGSDRPVDGAIPVPAQLPHGLFGFVGRGNELAALHALLPAEDAAADRTPMAICILEGAAGIGKTSLAVHFAHIVADRFTDGQLFIDLRGFSPDQSPLSPSEALGQLLRGLGVRPQQIPAEPDDQARMYRSLLAGRRVLIVLDNAATPEQVRPLLPGNPACVVIVTSRLRLSGLTARDGARRVTVGVLSPAESEALVAGTVAAAADSLRQAVTILDELRDPRAANTRGRLESLTRPGLWLGEMSSWGDRSVFMDAKSTQY